MFMCRLKSSKQNIKGKIASIRSFGTSIGSEAENLENLCVVLYWVITGTFRRNSPCLQVMQIKCSLSSAT